MEVPFSTSDDGEPRARALIGRQIELAVVLLVLAFIGSAWVAVQSAWSVRDQGLEIAHIVEFVGALHETLALLHDVEADQRDFLLTRREDLLAPFHQADAELTNALQQLRERLPGRPDQEQWLADFRELIEAERRELSRVLQLTQERNTEQALALISGEEGRRRMDAIRGAVSDRQQQDLVRLRAARDAAVAALTRAVVMGVGAAVLGVAIVAASFVRFRHELAARQKLVDDLFQQREQLRVTLLSIGDGVIVTDGQGRVQTVNGMAERLTGWSNEAALGRPLDAVFQIMHESTRERLESVTRWALKARGTPGPVEHMVLIANQGPERAIDCSVAQVRGAGGALLGAILVFRDVTEQRAAQASLLESQRRKDEFLAMLGHELRNPLAGILNGVQVLRMLGPQGDAAKMQEVIERQAAHMSRMVDDLLDISRFARGKQTLRREHLELGELLRVTVDDYRNSQLLEACELTTDLPETEAWVWGDRTRLAQAVSNLIHNGCKFCDRPNQVNVTLRVEDATSCAVITVSDRGIGMDAVTLAHVFQPFVQADASMERSRGGLGLGLAVVQGLVKLHNGQVTASSDGLGCGSQFAIRLPLSANPTPANNVPLETAARQRQVLIIDDRRDAVMPLEKMLQMSGHQVHTASSGAEGLETARAIRPSVVLCDIGLGNGMTGYDVARAMRRHPELADVYLVAVTGYGQEDDRQRAQAAGFDYHLTKPVSKQELDVVVGHMPRF